METRDRIRLLAKAAGIKTDADLAAAIGTSPSYLCQVLNGYHPTRKDSTVPARLAQRLGVSEADLFGDEGAA